MNANVLMVFVSCPPAKCEKLARSLIEDRLAACVNIIPAAKSVYRWKQKVRVDTESLLVIKTTSARFKALKTAVLKRHPYELPEVIAVKMARGHRPYLKWIIESCE